MTKRLNRKDAVLHKCLALLERMVHGEHEPQVKRDFANCELCLLLWEIKIALGLRAP